MTGPPALSGSVLIGPDETRAVLHVWGEIDWSTAAEFRELLERTAAGRLHLVLDLSGVGFLDAAGLGVIAGVAGQLKLLGGSVELRSPSELIYRICSITRLAEVVHVEPPLTGRPQRSERLRPGLCSPYGLDVRLQRLARLARVELPGADGVSITLPRHGRLRTVAATDEVALGMDHDQYDTGEGPCLDAAAQGRRVQTGSLPAESRWPAFVPKARARGVEAILSVPLFTAGRPAGAMNAYARTRGALPDQSAGWAELLAAEGFTALTAESAGPDRPADDAVRAALRSRETIAQAQGVVMARDGLPAAAAHAVLRLASSRTNRPLRDVAADCLAAALGTGAPPDTATGPPAVDAWSEAADPAPLLVRPFVVQSEVSPRQPDGTIYLRAGGDWTGTAARQVRALFDLAYRRRPTLVVADLAGVGAMDLAGLEALIAAGRRLAASGCILELQNVPPRLRRQLESTEFDRNPLAGPGAPSGDEEGKP